MYRFSNGLVLVGERQKAFHLTRMALSATFPSRENQTKPICYAENSWTLASFLDYTTARDLVLRNQPFQHLFFDDNANRQGHQHC
jgi:hypothetical protein